MNFEACGIIGQQELTNFWEIVPFKMADVISWDSLLIKATEWLLFVFSADGVSSGGEHRYICDGDAHAGGHVCQLPRPRCRTS